MRALHWKDTIRSIHRWVYKTIELRMLYDKVICQQLWKQRQCAETRHLTPVLEPVESLVHMFPTFGAMNSLLFTQKAHAAHHSETTKTLALASTGSKLAGCIRIMVHQTLVMSFNSSPQSMN